MKRKNSANLLVRESITQALFRLLKRKSINEISITELVTLAGVSRNSFYRNYSSIEDILHQYLTDKTSIWWDALVQNPPEHILQEVFRFLLSIGQELQIIYKAGLSHMLMDLIVQCSKVEQTDDLIMIYKHAAHAGILWGVSNEWIIRGMVETPEEMERIILSENTQSG